MIHLRNANAADARKIASLHAESWRKHYRGIWSDKFLDNDVYKDRIDTWQNRFEFPEENQHVIIAESDSTLAGFACIYLDDDAVFGTLLDNLHVSAAFQGHGIGTRLIKAAAGKCHEHRPASRFYLWVLEENGDARNFYEHLGATNYELTDMENPDGTFSKVCRYTWQNVNDLL